MYQWDDITDGILIYVSRNSIFVQSWCNRSKIVEGCNSSRLLRQLWFSFTRRLFHRLCTCLNNLSKGNQCRDVTGHHHCNQLMAWCTTVLILKWKLTTTTIITTSHYDDSHIMTMTVWWHQSTEDHQHVMYLNTSVSCKFNTTTVMTKNMLVS